MKKTSLARLWAGLFVASVILLFGRPLVAQPAADARDDAEARGCPTCPEAAPALGKRERARALAVRGTVLAGEKNYEAALAVFEQSFDLFPTHETLRYVAGALFRLERYDEALDRYDTLERELGADLSEKDRAEIREVRASARTKVGFLQISSSAGGRLFIDDRPRGPLPRPGKIPVMGGRHLVRIVEEGHEPHQLWVDIENERVTGPLAVRLLPLVASGWLVVEDEAGEEGAQVIVDGAPRGLTRWEGRLAPGDHSIWIRSGESGSRPRAVRIVEGQTALLRLSQAPLGDELRITADPKTATIAADDVALGTGSVAMRLPAGSYRVTASEKDFTTERRLVTVRKDAPASSLFLRLAYRRAWGRAWASAFMGYAGAWGLQSTAEQACPGACRGESPTANGALVGARVGFRFAFGVSAEVMGGYLATWSDLTREVDSTFVTSTTPEQRRRIRYELTDAIDIRGPLMGLGLSYRLPTQEPLGLVLRVSGGALFATATDRIHGRASTGFGAPANAPLVVFDTDVPARYVTPFAMPEIGVDVRFAPIRVGLSLGALILPSEAPAFVHQTVHVRARAKDCVVYDEPGSVACAPEQRILQGERAHGATLLFVPQVTAEVDL